jgi:hypothetical protein
MMLRLTFNRDEVLLLNAPLPIPGTCDPCKAKVAIDDDLLRTPIRTAHESAFASL